MITAQSHHKHHILRVVQNFLEELFTGPPLELRQHPWTMSAATAEVLCNVLCLAFVLL